MDEIERDDAGDFAEVVVTLRRWDGRQVAVDVMGLGTTAAVPGVLVELRGILHATSEPGDPVAARFEVGDGSFSITHNMVAAEWLDDDRLQLQVRQAGLAFIVAAGNLSCYGGSV